MLDLQFISQTSSEGISYLATYLALGYMLGSLVALLMRWLNRQITIGFALSLQAITLAVMPHCKQLSWLSIVCVTYGFGGGAFDSSLTVWLIEMWPKSSESFLQAAHLTFGLGMIIGPLVCAPFVYGEQSVITLANGTNVTITNKMREDLLTIPFSLSSAIQFLSKICLAGYYCCCWQKTNFSFSQSPFIYVHQLCNCSVSQNPADQCEG